jgi:voltage-dependent potassium channel beta subunit
MLYRNLGRTGLKVSALSYGAWVTFGTQVDVKQAKEIMWQYYQAGVNFFDNAETYSDGKAEEVMGQAVKELVSEGKLEREDLVLSTKIFFGYKNPRGPNDKGLSRKHIIEGTKAALKRFQLDYVDLVFCHRPDVATPIEETVRAMNFVIDQGWAFYWGTSEWNAQQITEAQEVAQRLGLIGPAFEQPEYNLFARQKVEKEYLPLYQNYGLGLTTWSPLASGILSGKYSKGHVPEGSRLALEAYKGLKEKKLVEDILNKVDALKPIAEELGCSLAQLALAWSISNPHVSTTISGASKPEQVSDNLGAVKVVDKLTPEIKKKIDDIVKTAPEQDMAYGRQFGDQKFD